MNHPRNTFDDSEETSANMNLNTTGTTKPSFTNTTVNQTSSFDKSLSTKPPHSTQENAVEKEMDDIADLRDKFKSILMSTNAEDGEDCLIYGMSSNLLTDKHKIKQGTIISNDETFLQFLNPKSKNNQICFKIALSSISDMTIGKGAGNLKSQTLPLPEECCLTIHYCSNLKHYDLIFQDNSHLELFITGLISILQKRVKEGNSYDTDLLSLKRIWKEYDPEHNKFLNVTQFSTFLKNINFDFKNKSPEKIFQEIDTKNEGKIRFKDFISFYERIVTGEEFREVFEKYSTVPDKNYLTIKGLVDFMEKEQHETFTQEDALELVCKYSKKARKLEHNGLTKNKRVNSSNKDKQIITTSYRNKSVSVENTESMIAEYENHSFGKGIDDSRHHQQTITMIRNNNNIDTLHQHAFQLSFREFVNLIIDKQNNIYDQNEFKHHHNMDLPLTDYYCNSSHNTYLTGNQITSESKVEMYSYVLKNGCRFVDLDTFDGRDGDKVEPIITHWHFPVGDILFKDALLAIKEHAFIKSEFPVILSLENHCTALSQERMEKYFVEILGRENIFILDSQNPPLFYPSPNELRKKFIIKNKRKRIFGNLDKMKHDYQSNSSHMFNIDNTNNNEGSTTITMHNTSGNNSVINENNKNNNDIVDINNNNSNNNNNGNSSSGNVVSLKNNLNEKKAHIIRSVKEVIQEEDISTKSMDSDIDEDVPTITNAHLKCKDNSNSQRVYKLIQDIPNYNSSIYPCNKLSFEFLGNNNENTLLSQHHAVMLTRKKSKKKAIEMKDDKYSSLSTLSNSKLQKLKEKYLPSSYSSDILNQDPQTNLNTPNNKTNQVIRRIEEIQLDFFTKAHHVPIITVERLANILGMVGVKYHKETFDPTKFLPWECISIAEPDILKYISTFEGKCKLIEYCQKSFLKVYPDTFRTNSSNHNPIMCWALGCQFAALNLQTTEDDYVLLNKMFFKVNGGSKCGYVLKPQRLREYNKDKYRKLTIKPCYKIKFKILSGFHLHLCCPKKGKITGMFIEVSLKTPSSNTNFKEGNDKSNENKLVTTLVNKNFLHPVWESNSVVFDIYEPELSFIVVKLFSKKREHTLARGIIPVRAMLLGYRVLELYDNECSKFDESYLIVKTNKIFN